MYKNMYVYMYVFKFINREVDILNHKNINQLISEAMAIEAQDAKEAGTLGYMCRSLVQATLPHRRVQGNEFTRINGDFTLSVLVPSSASGLPFGSIPRLLIAWIATEAVKTKERELILGNSLSDFIRSIGYEVRGGTRGDITRVRDQMERLFSCYISCSHVNDKVFQNKNLIITDKANLWWEPKGVDQINLFTSTITLSQAFFDEITNNPVPVDLRALKALKRSPMALDIYSWLTYRNSYLKRSTVIPWESLQMQFGAEYKRTIDFKIAFLDQVKNVHSVYPEANLEENKHGLMLKPSPTHVKPI